MSKLLDILENAGQEDLDEIDKEIKSLFTRIEKAKKVREFIASGMFGQTVIEVCETPQVESETEENTSPNRLKVLRYMGTQKVPMSGGKIMDALNCSRGSQSVILNHPWFTRKDEGYVLTKYGKDTYRKNFQQPRA